MRINAIAVTPIVVLVLASVAVTQGAVRTADEGSREGYRVAGPLGGILGGAVGLGGLLGVNQRLLFLEYATRKNHDSSTYNGQVEVGTVLPDNGVSYYDVPPEYNLPLYKYAIVNGRTVLVDPQSHRIVQIVN
jgi:hypothetical protein